MVIFCLAIDVYWDDFGVPRVLEPPRLFFCAKKSRPVHQNVGRSHASGKKKCEPPVLDVIKNHSRITDGDRVMRVWRDKFKLVVVYLAQHFKPEIVVYATIRKF